MKQIEIFYDGWCNICVRTRNIICKLDWFNLIKFHDLRQCYE